MPIYDCDGNVISTGSTTVLTTPNIVRFKKVNSINHRGWYEAPENTLPAYKESKTHGFSMAETDVSFTSDGVAVLLHDQTINRTARNADGSSIEQTINIHDITYSQALEYDFGIYKSQTYAGTKIPTLTEFLTLCRNLQIHPYIELKSNGDYSTVEISSVAQIVKDTGMRGNVTYISFSESYLQTIANLDSKARIGWLVNTISDATISAVQAFMNGATNNWFLNCSKYDATTVGKCRNADIPLEIWTIDSADIIASLDVFISGVTSNRTVASDVLYNANI